MLDIDRCLPEIDEYDIPQEIKDKAREIYTNLTRTNRRGNTRKRYIFYCIYHAYLDLGFNIDHNVVANLVGLPKNQIARAKSIAPDHGMSYNPRRIVVKTIPECIDSYYEMFFADRSAYDQVLQITESILAYDQRLNYEKPHRVAVIILMIIHEYASGCYIDKNSVAEILMCTWTSLSQLYRTISEIYLKIFNV